MLRHLEPQRLRGLEVDHQLEFGGLLDGQIRWFSAFQNPVYVIRHATEQIGQVRPVGHQSSRLYKLPNVIEGWQPLLCRQVHDARSMLKKKWVQAHVESARPPAIRPGKTGFDLMGR